MITGPEGLGVFLVARREPRRFCGRGGAARLGGRSPVDRGSAGERPVADRRWAAALAQAAGLGMLLAINTGIGGGIGYYLDSRWGTGPWLLLVGSLAGMGLGLYQVVSVLRGLERSEGRGRRQ